jgi:hypothetical protein
LRIPVKTKMSPVCIEHGTKRVHSITETTCKILYSKKLFICSQIIGKSQLTGKLTMAKFTLEQAMKAQKGSKGTALLIP